MVELRNWWQLCDFGAKGQICYQQIAKILVARLMLVTTMTCWLQIWPFAPKSQSCHQLLSSAISIWKLSLKWLSPKSLPEFWTRTPIIFSPHFAHVYAKSLSKHVRQKTVPLFSINPVCCNGTPHPGVWQTKHSGCQSLPIAWQYFPLK